VGAVELIVARLRHASLRGRSLALLFDYDGTLAPIRSIPSEAILPSATREALARLANVPKACVGVISGRALSDLRKMVDLDRVYYAGTSGLEIDLLGRLFTPPLDLVERIPLNQIADRLQMVAAHYPGVWLEKKPLGMTLHYRALALDQSHYFRSETSSALEPWIGLIRVDDVTFGTEIVPEVGWDKGTAVRRILADVNTDAFPMYAGDAANDSPALTTVRELGGLSVGIGPTAWPADVRLSDPNDVAMLTIMLADVLSETPEHYRE
jgi:trehalose 6-phosphate phosphatase